MSCGEGTAGTSEAEEQQLHLEVEAAMTEIPGSLVDGNARTGEVEVEPGRSSIAGRGRRCGHRGRIHAVTDRSNEHD
jgi:hypothetical protein